jgi:hypothetical protein
MILLLGVEETNVPENKVLPFFFRKRALLLSSDKITTGGNWLLNC